MHSHKWFRPFAVASTAALALLAFASPVAFAQDSTPEASTMEAPAPNTDLTGELNFMGFGLGDEIATERVAYAQEQLPNVTFNFNEGGFDAQQFLTAFASGNPPDIVYIDRQTLGTYAANGTFMSLDQCIADQGIDMSQYRDVAVNQVTIEGHVYGIPEFFNSLMLFINTKAVNDAGLTLDDISTTDWSNSLTSTTS